MNNILVSLYDIKSEQFETVTCFSNKAVAQRYISSIKDSIPFFYDKVPYVIGVFDLERGVVQPCEHYPLFDEVVDE